MLDGMNIDVSSMLLLERLVSLGIYVFEPGDLGPEIPGTLGLN